MNMDKIKKQWYEYNEEFDNSEYMDIDTHTSMAMQVGRLISEVEKQQKIIEELTSLNLWSARRLHKTHKDFAYSELDELTGQKHERI